MNLSSRLILLRDERELKLNDIATMLEVPIKSYLEFESGSVEMSEIIIEKLSHIYQLPKEFFVTENMPKDMRAEVLYANCTFISGSGSGNGYINHQYNDRGIDEIIFSTKEEIKRLLDQVNQLHIQNAKLVDLISSKII